MFLQSHPSRDVWIEMPRKMGIPTVNTYKALNNSDLLLPNNYQHGHIKKPFYHIICDETALFLIGYE